MPAAAKTPWLTVREVKNQAGEEVTEMVISGVIGSSWYDSSGATSKEFRESLAAIAKGKKVLVRINSEGGSVQDALEIYNLIQARKEDITTRNDGYALSSASVILCAGGRSITPHSSITMIHEPWSMTMGDEGDHLKAAEMLAKHGDTIAGIYSRKTGKPAAEMRDLMKKETWLTGAEACQNRFADAMAEDAQCPGCGHGQCSECEVDGDQITCSECDATNTAEEWEESDAERESEQELIEDRATRSQLEERYNRTKAALSKFSKVPEKIWNMLKPKLDPKKPISAAALAAAGLKKPTDAPASGTQPKDKMNKTAILALLKTRGVEIADDASDEVILAALGKLGEQSTANGKERQELEAVKAQLQAEKKIRVSDKVKRLAENKIANDKLEWWVNLAMGNEAETYAQIEGLPVQHPGGEPLGTRLSVTENRLEEIQKAHKGPSNAAKRFEIIRGEYDQLMSDALIRDQRMGMTEMQLCGNGSNMRRAYPVNANSYSATLVTSFLIDGAATKLQNRWAPLKVFSKDYSQDRYKPRATGQLKYVTAGGTTQKNATNFESGDATVTPSTIAVDQYTTAMHVTNDELNSGLRMENLVDIKVAECADNILKVAFGPLDTTTIVTNTKIIRAATSFSFSDMATASGSLKKSLIKYAVLDGEYMARIENSPVFYQATGTMNGASDGWMRFGWDGVFTNSNWTGTHAGANDQHIRGLFCNPQVLGAIAGLPLNPPTVPGNTLEVGSFTVPGCDVSVSVFSWFSLATRTFWMSYDLMFGSALLDESAGVLLTDA